MKITLLVLAALLAGCDHHPDCTVDDMDQFGMSLDCLNTPSCHLTRSQIQWFAYDAAVCRDDPIVWDRVSQPLSREIRATP